jgi:3',5'-cyclic AMP phosphodiesterase CpdA
MITDSRIRDRIVFFTDLHFWKVVWNPLHLLNKRLLGNANLFLRRRHQFPMLNARPFAMHALATGARTVLIGGDLTSTATDAEFRLARGFIEFLQRQGAEVLTVLGNHDVYTFEASRRRRPQKHLQPWLPESGFPAQLALNGGTPIVLLPTARPRLLSSRGHFGAEEARAAADRIAATPPGPVLVCGHYPALSETAGYGSKWGHRLDGEERLRRTLGECGRAVLYVSGHVHRFSSTPDPDFDSVHHLTGPAFFNHWRPANRHGGFLQIDCGTSGFEVRHHWKAEHWQCDVVKIRDGVSLS